MMMMENEVLKDTVKKLKYEENKTVEGMKKEHEETVVRLNQQIKHLNLSHNMVCTSKNLSFGA